MQYKVPQNVDIADKVIGGLTLRQFMFLMITGGAVLVSYLFFKGIPVVFFALATILILFGVALAFLKINERPFEVFLVSIGKSLLSPPKRYWEKDVSEKQEPAPVITNKKQTPLHKESVENIRSNLQNIAFIVDSGGQVNDQNRITNLKPKGDPHADLPDIIGQTEKPAESVSKLLEDATNFVVGQKNEPPISAIASVKTTKDDFQYDRLKLTSEKETENILENVKQKQATLETALDTATIIKNKQEA